MLSHTWTRAAAEARIEERPYTRVVWQQGKPRAGILITGIED